MWEDPCVFIIMRWRIVHSHGLVPHPLLCTMCNSTTVRLQIINISICYLIIVWLIIISGSIQTLLCMHGFKDEDKNHFLQFRSVHSLLAAATNVCFSWNVKHTFEKKKEHQHNRIVKSIHVFCILQKKKSHSHKLLHLSDLNLTTFFSDGGPLVTYRAPGRAGRGIARCWGWPPPHGAWGHPPCWASGKWGVCWRWDSTAGPPGGRSSPSGFWSTPWMGEREKGWGGVGGGGVGGGWWECQAEQVEHLNWD